MRVYYLTGAQYALGNIALRRIKIARLADLNDPFELLAIDLADKSHRRAFNKMKERLNADNGLLCFSRAWSNPLLWGHYAEKHTGICLGFDVPDTELVPVIYTNTRMKIGIDPDSNSPIITEEMMNRLMRTKFRDWKYEEELRAFIKLDHNTCESGLYFKDFDEGLNLKEVILGPRCELPIERVRTMVKSFDLDVSVIKARIAYRSFRVVKNQTASRQ